jgi:hypothetical protein
MPATFNFHTDPGHGWLQVAERHLEDLGLKPEDFSSFSYRRSGNDETPTYFYLEEDCDAPKFLKAHTAKYGDPAFLYVYDDAMSFIRELPRMRPIEPLLPRRIAA